MSQTRSKDMGDSSITRLYRTIDSIEDFYIEKNLAVEIKHREDVSEYFEDTYLYMFRILIFDSEFYCDDALVIENDPNNNTAGFWKYMDDFIEKKKYKNKPMLSELSPWLRNKVLEVLRSDNFCVDVSAKEWMQLSANYRSEIVSEIIKYFKRDLICSFSEGDEELDYYIRFFPKCIEGVNWRDR